MPVTADSYESKVSEAIVQMVADSETFRTLTGAASPTAAKAFIVEDDDGIAHKAVSGATIDTELAFAAVRVGECIRVERAWNTYGREGDAKVWMETASTSGDTPAEAMRRARNLHGAIADEMQAMIGAAAARIAYATINLGETSLCAEDGSKRTKFLTEITIAWRDIP